MTPWAEVTTTVRSWHGGPIELRNTVVPEHDEGPYHHHYRNEWAIHLDGVYKIPLTAQTARELRGLLDIYQATA